MAVLRASLALALLALAAAPAVAESSGPLRAVPRPAKPAKADALVVWKELRLLLVLRGEEVLRTYEVALGSDPEGPKHRRGDGRTPEGRYSIAGRNPGSRFHRALRISYPNAGDRRRAAAAGASPGGDVMIHGLPDGLGAVGPDHTTVDWTDGCIAVTNEEIDEIWELVDDGTPIRILP